MVSEGTWLSWVRSLEKHCNNWPCPFQKSHAIKATTKAGRSHSDRSCQRITTLENVVLHDFSKSIPMLMSKNYILFYTRQYPQTCHSFPESELHYSVRPVEWTDFETSGNNRIIVEDIGLCLGKPWKTCFLLNIPPIFFGHLTLNQSLQSHSMNILGLDIYQSFHDRPSTEGYETVSLVY